MATPVQRKSTESIPQVSIKCLRKALELASKKFYIPQEPFILVQAFSAWTPRKYMDGHYGFINVLYGSRIWYMGWIYLDWRVEGMGQEKEMTEWREHGILGSFISIYRQDQVIKSPILLLVVDKGTFAECKTWKNTQCTKDIDSTDLKMFSFQLGNRWVTTHCTEC